MIGRIMTGDRIKFKIDDQGLEVRISVERGKTTGPDYLRRMLDEAGVVFGVDEGEVHKVGRSLASSGYTVFDQLIASARPPQPGFDGFLETYFEVGIQPGTIRADGTFDFRERELLKSVHEDDLIGRYHPPAPGEPGKNVFGVEIPVPSVQDRRPRKGPGVHWEEESGLLRAARDGVVYYQVDERIDVVNHYHYEGDVNLQSGNLDMNGSLTIQGNVNFGSRVCVTSDLEIKGMVDGGSVHSGGSILISGGVSGQNQGILRGSGDIRILHAQAARVESGSRIEVKRDSVTSQLVGREVILGGRTVGGEIRVEKWLKAKVVGTPVGTPTTVILGQPISHAADAALQALNRSKNLRSMERGGRGGNRGKTGRGKLNLQNGEVQQKRERRRRTTEILRAAFAEFRETVHPGVVICFDRCRREIHETLHSVRFRYDHDKQVIFKEDI